MLRYQKIKEDVIAVKSTEEGIICVVCARNGVWYYWGNTQHPVGLSHFRILNQMNKCEIIGSEYEMY